MITKEVVNLHTTILLEVTLQIFNNKAIILCRCFIIGSNSEHGGEEPSRAHDNNGTYIH